MKLRVRVQGRTSEVVLHGSDPRVSELYDAIRSSVLGSHGLSADSDFSLSLSGSERLQNSDQTLKDCGVVSGDLIYVGLPPAAHSSSSSSSSSADTASCSIPVRPEKVGGSTTDATSTSLTPHTDPDPEEKPLSWEPMVCGEAEPGQVPPTLERLLLSTECCSSSDALMVAAHLMMLESGFRAQDRELKWSHVPPGWRSTAGVYRLNYVHPLCDGVVVTTAAVCLNSKLSINMILKVENNTICTHNLVLTPSTYVMDQCSGGRAAAAAFKDLRKLSRLFKDQLAYRMIAAARDALNLPPFIGLAALPPEILLLVVRMLDVRSVVRLSAVSRHFRAATSDPSLWKHLYCRDYHSVGSGSHADWRELYIGRFKARRDLRRRTEDHFVPYPIGIPPPFHLPVPAHPIIPGIIGGDYDQRPVLPHPRYDPIGPLPPHGRPRFWTGRGGQRATDIRRGFI